MLKDIATDVDSNFYDTTLSETSVNAVQNQVITKALNKKQDVISDLSEIRNKANSALQSVPSEYITEDELASKGYLTEHQDISGKQDKIADLAQIRDNAQKGATALQFVPEKYATKIDVSNEVAKIVNSAPKAFDTLKEIADWIEEDAEPAIVLANKVEQKADKTDVAEALAKKADKSEIPTKMSQLEQDVEIGSSYDDTEIKQELTELSAKIENININSIPIVKSKDELGKLNVPLGSIGSIVSEEYTFEVKPSQVEPGTIIKEIKFNPTPPNYFDYANEHSIHFGSNCEFSSGSSAISVRAGEHGPSYDWWYTTSDSEGVALIFTKQDGQTVFEDEAILTLNEMLRGLSYKFNGVGYQNFSGQYDEYFIETANNFIDSCLTFVCYKPAEVSGPYVKTSKGIDEPTPRKFSDFGKQPELFPKEERIVKNIAFSHVENYPPFYIKFQTVGGTDITAQVSPHQMFKIFYADTEEPIEELDFINICNNTEVYYTGYFDPDGSGNNADFFVSADFPLPPLNELKTWTPIAMPIPSDDIDSLLDEVFGGGYYYYSDDGIGSWDDDTDDDGPITISLSYFGKNPEDYPIEERVIKNIQYIGDWTTQEEVQIQIGLITSNNVNIYVDSSKYSGLRIHAYGDSYDSMGWIEATEEILQELNNYIENNTVYLMYISDSALVDNTFTAEFPNVILQQSEEIENINTENNETGS